MASQETITTGLSLCALQSPWPTPKPVREVAIREHLWTSLTPFKGPAMHSGNDMAVSHATLPLTWLDVRAVSIDGLPIIRQVIQCGNTAGFFWRGNRRKLIVHGHPPPGTAMRRAFHSGEFMPGTETTGNGSTQWLTCEDFTRVDDRARTGSLPNCSLGVHRRYQVTLCECAE
jgi:hypothetical protein